MASQRVIIAKVGGAAGDAMVQRFLQRRLRNLTRNLRENSSALPVHYYAEHVDLWSAGDLFGEVLTPSPRRRPLERWLGSSVMYCYRLPDDGALAASLQKQLRSKSLRDRQPQETRWLVQSLLEAVLAWDPLVKRSAIVVVRETVGGFVRDEEVLASLKGVPRWLR